jgi:polyhydroxybutyrate depolymerase
MFSRRTLLIAAALAFCPAVGFSADKVELKKVTWKVDKDTREALVYVPAGTQKSLIFAWHGHGGTAEFAARKFTFHTLWPDAVVVYPQGLPTPAPLIDPDGKKSGWQKSVGDQDDRDLKFFDAMLKTCLADYQVDKARVFSAGHSNGGFFTYVLAAARGKELAAIAPVAATLTPQALKDLKPKPVLHVAGQKDPIVKFVGQERTIDAMRKLNECEAEGKPAGTNCVEYKSKNGNPVVTFIHPGGHEIPEGAPERIVAFFKDVSKK